MKRKVVSITWPWDHGKVPVDKCVAHLAALNADEVCLRGPVYFEPVAPTHLAPVGQAYYAELIGKLPEGVGVSLWPVVSLYNPELMADRIAEWTEHYDPDVIYLDAERHWVTDYISNLPRFLKRLTEHKVAGRIKCPIGLGSYRRADYHTNMHWQVWLNFYIGQVPAIDFLCHQLYPDGWKTPLGWRGQMKQDVASHQAECVKAHRPTIEWIPWMPAYTEHGWTPTAECVAAGVEQLVADLGDRLLGYNWWSLDQNLVEPQHAGEYALIKIMPADTAPAPPPAPPATTEERVAALEREARLHGWPV